MTHGICRKPFQVLPKSGARITCVKNNEDGQNTDEWFEQSMIGWYAVLELDRKRNWDFVLVVPWISVRQFWCGNDGMTAWRHRASGYVVPDHCRQTGGCPELWNSSDVKGRRELLIKNLAEVEPYIVLDHSQVRTCAFPEARSQGKLPTFSIPSGR
jgi:hypothetical protein